MNLRKALKMGMASAEMNQEQLAKKVGYCPAMISLIMNDHRSVGLNKMEKIAEALGMKLSALIALGEES